ncbi:galactose ABC transporter substrate-binding protein [Brachyspira pilosicoli]|uniref:D-galactose/methyl-galactoside binding periplasmic protein MglB n=1 Tax=Brachyspira pilosicoli TaxID=52584 RepID=A0A5C8FA25_BRAPL|nr:galactose ABC transporter substrate-binding protein [Brachyspira pilosicoli]TXJ46826.1 galactose glucose-binding protein [Brachyspira pilosicoli]
MFRRILIFVILLFISSSLIFTQNKKSTIGVALYRFDDNYIQYLKNYIEKNIGNKASLTIIDSHNSQITQNDQIDIFLNKNVNLIAINLVNENYAQTIINKVSVRNIPIIFFNREPSLEVLNSYNNVWYIGGSSENAGRAQGRVIADSWKSHSNWDKNEDGKIQCVIIRGRTNSFESENRTQYMKDYLKNNNIKLDILAEVYAFDNRKTASIEMDKLMTKYSQKIEYIIANDDNMALGALDSIKKLGFNSDSRMLNYIPIVGIGGTPEYLEAIKNYSVFATVMQNPSTQAEVLSKVSLNIINNKAPLDGTTLSFDNNKYIFVPYIPITMFNLDRAIEIYK